MNKEESKKPENFTLEESGTDEVTAQVMDSYNDGAIDCLVTSKKNDKQTK